ncbi:pinin isoform X1 [Culex quinquefasciatus]|uniref:pinin isoform X1 n=1 Tax=Culex quinquefasciatus TaxID=7176 RepID=UPI0018E3DD33|nr:pinin isoform X1 [Culex quinquefasciatus]
MATDIIKGYSHLQQELNRARDNLKGLNENIRKIIGRDPSTTEQYTGGNSSFGTYSRNEPKKRGFESTRRPGDQQDRRFSDGGGAPNAAKRRAVGETISVFSRLSGPPSRDAEYEKPRIHSRVIKEQPTRQEIVAAQGSDEKSRARNRRIFGSLLGTLQKFTQEESKLKSKEEKKAQIEKKLEEQQKVERENMRKEKQCLFTDRKRQQLEIRAIETKMNKMKDLEAWEETKKPLANFIKTKTSPHIYFLPKKMDTKMEKKLKESQEEHKKMMDTKRQEVLESIASVEARFKADIRNLEENANRNKSETGVVVANPPSSKHDRIAVDEEEDDDHDDHQLEGPALPSTGFKITIQNHDVAQVKSEGSPKVVRLVDGPIPANPKSGLGTSGDGDGRVVGSDSASSSSYLNQGENFQITFKTDRDGDSE